VRSQWDEVHWSSLRELARHKVLDGVFAYGEYVFGYRPADCHREMIEIMLDAVAKAGTPEAENVVIEEPRGHAKTTWGDTIFLCWLISQFPHLRIGLLSKKDELAYDFSKAIRWTFENNPRHIEIFGNNISSAKWTDKEWYHRDSPWQGQKDMTLFAAGTGSAIVSKRFDIILCDDIIDDENSRTPEAREAIETWWQKTVRPCLTPNGIIIMLGTRWAVDDLYETLTTPKEGQAKAGFRLVLRQAINIDPVTKERKALWPEHWPLWKLDEEHVAMGTAYFSCAYQNDVSGLAKGNIFLKQNFQYYDKLDPEKFYSTRMGIDLASSERQTADYTARVVTAEDDEGNFYVMSVYRDRRETGHTEFVNDGYTAFPSMSLVLCENNAFMSTLVQGVMKEYPRIPIEGRKTDVDKVRRGRGIAAKYEAHKVWHHRSLKDGDFEQELLQFPKGHDDMVDAEGFSMDLGGDTFSFASVRR
jgi:predicted phage terminase large subunit-like protein